MSQKFSSTIQEVLDKACVCDKLFLTSLRLEDFTATQAAFEQGYTLRKELVGEHSKRGDLKLVIADTYENLACQCVDLGRAQVAETAFNLSLSLREEVVAAEPRNPTALHALSVACQNLGCLYLQVGQSDTARDWFVLERTHLCELMEIAPEHEDLPTRIESSYMNLGNAILQAGDAASARDQFRKCAELRESSVSADPGNIWAKRTLSTVYLKLSQCESVLADPIAAGRWSQKALRLRMDAAEAAPTEPELQNELALAYMIDGDAGLARNDRRAGASSYRAGLTIIKALIEVDPSNPSYRNLQSVLNDKLSGISPGWFKRVLGR